MILTMTIWSELKSYIRVASGIAVVFGALERYPLHHGHGRIFYDGQA